MKMLCALIAMLPSIAAGQVAPPETLYVSVNATRSARVPADRVITYIVVEGTAETGADAEARLNKKLSAVSLALARMSGSVRVDKPVSYGVSPAPVQGYPPPTTTTFVARSVVRATVTRLDQLAAIQSAVLAAGASGTTAQTYEASSADSVRRTLITEAVAAAKADAEAIATATGLTLGSIRDLSSSFSQPYGDPGYMTFDQRSMPQARTPEVVVTAQVSVRYRAFR